MSESTRPRGEQFRFLFRNVTPADGVPATNRRAVAWLAENGGPTIGSQHLNNVRNGGRNATHDLLVGLAAYFSVPVQYWDDPVVERAVRLDIAAADSGVVALRAHVVREVATMTTDRLQTTARWLDLSGEGQSEA